MKAINKSTWDNAAEYSDYTKLPAGGYVCSITDVEDVSEKEYLSITYDIAEGIYADYYSNEWGRSNPWTHRFIRSYKDSAVGMLKGFLKAVDDSNGTSFATEVTSGFDEHRLLGRQVGLILREEEYESNHGDIRTRLSVYRVVSVDMIRKGDYTVPAVKRLEVKTVTPMGFFKSDNDELPF